jgi:hypothetical protein
MRISHFSGYAFGICAVAAMLAGCDGSQPPITATAAMPQRPAIATHERGKSWMLPGNRQNALMYLSAKGKSYVLSYPDGKLEGTIDVGAYGVCADTSGNVFIPSGSSTYEYSHGSTAPSATGSSPTILRHG